MKEACDEADKDFMEIALSAANENEDRRHDRSGSCAVVMVTIDDNCYICNIGDSRAVISQNGGASRFALTRDHKPNDKMEQKRIADAGGSVYQYLFGNSHFINTFCPGTFQLVQMGKD